MAEKYIYDDGSGVVPKQNLRKLFIAKYQETYANRSSIIFKYYIKDTSIHWVYSGRKLKCTGSVYFKGSPYRDAEGSSQLRSCLHYAIVNAYPRIGGGVYKN